MNRNLFSVPFLALTLVTSTTVLVRAISPALTDPAPTDPAGTCRQCNAPRDAGARRGAVRRRIVPRRVRRHACALRGVGAGRIPALARLARGELPLALLRPFGLAFGDDLVGTGMRLIKALSGEVASAVP